MSQTERRCPRCGALVASDASWCGQCLEPLPAEPERAPAASVPEPTAPPARGAGTEPTWECPACDHVNAIALDRCEVCGTAFGQLFAEPEERVDIDPSRAMAWSLLWPGLGHWKAGHRSDGIARMVLFAWTFGTVLVLVLSRGDQGFGSAATVFSLFLVASVMLYVVSAADARRIAAGEEPFVGSRLLLWASVGLVVISVLLATLLTLPAARGG